MSDTPQPPAASAVIPPAPEAPPAPPASHEADAARFFANDPTPGIQLPGDKPKAPVVPDKPAEVAPTADKPPVKADAPAEVQPSSLVSKIASKSKGTPAPARPSEAPKEVDPTKVLDDLPHPTNRDQWDKYKSTAKQTISGLQDQLIKANAREAELKKRLDSGISAPSEEIEKLRKEHKEFSDRLMILDLQNHPQYRRQFAEPMNAAKAQAKELLQANGVENVDIDRLLSLPRAEFGKAVSEAAKGLSTFDQTDFASQMRTAFQIREQERAALSQADQTRQALVQKSGEMGRIAFNRVSEKLAATTSEWLPTIESDPNASPEQREADRLYNEGISSLREDAERIAFASTSEEEIAANAYKAAAFDKQTRFVIPRLAAEYQSLLEQHQKVVAEFNAIRARNPNRDRLHAAPMGEGGVDISKMGHEEAAKYMASQGG